MITLEEESYITDIQMHMYIADPEYLCATKMNDLTIWREVQVLCKSFVYFKEGFC